MNWAQVVVGMQVDYRHERLTAEAEAHRRARLARAARREAEQRTRDKKPTRLVADRNDTTEQPARKPARWLFRRRPHRRTAVLAGKAGRQD